MDKHTNLIGLICFITASLNMKISLTFLIAFIFLVKRETKKPPLSEHDQRAHSGL